MKSIREAIFSKRVLEIDVNFIEKYIHCSLQGGPSGGPACPPVFYKEILNSKMVIKKLTFISILLTATSFAIDSRRELLVPFFNHIGFEVLLRGLSAFFEADI